MSLCIDQISKPSAPIEPTFFSGVWSSK